MHLYNAWLPPLTADEVKKEGLGFRSVVKSAKESWKKDDPDSVRDSVKWISIVDLYIQAKSDIDLKDVKELLEFGLEFFLSSQDMNTQTRWGDMLNKLLKKYGKKVSLVVNWKLLYDNLMNMHFKRNTGPEGWKLKMKHIFMLKSLVQNCRKFFPAGSSSEIWSEFSGFLQNPWSHSAIEGAGLLNLFLSVNLKNSSFFTSEWVEKCLDIWESLPNCKLWDFQWMSILARCIEYCSLINWEIFLPRLFTHYLNIFEVSPSYDLEAEQFFIDSPDGLQFLFYNPGEISSHIFVAKSIVYLFGCSSKTQIYFQKLVDKLERFFHPSNEQDSNKSLDCFLLYLVTFFKIRISSEICRKEKEGRKDWIHLGKLERETFVKTVLKLLEQGQYSKYDELSVTVLSAISVLSFVEPSLVLPFISSRFQLALETTTATHQLSIDLTSVASAGRAFLLFSNSENLKDQIVKFLSFAVMALDANDPPKSTAAMELICSIFSNILSVEALDLSEWLEEFFSRLFLYLRNMESNNVAHDGLSSQNSKTYCPCCDPQRNPRYSLMLKILLGKLPQPLIKQAIEKISRFVNENFLPGIITPISSLCSACVEIEPELSGPHIIHKILTKTVSLLKEITTKDGVSTSLLNMADYHLNILSSTIRRAGMVLIPYQNELKEAISLAFMSPSWKINLSGGSLLNSLLRSLLFYYPIDQYKSFAHENGACLVDPLICVKDCHSEKAKLKTEYYAPKWHIANKEEVLLANILLTIHLESALDYLVSICQSKMDSPIEGSEKEGQNWLIKIYLLQIESSLDGVLTCLREINPKLKNSDFKPTEIIQNSEIKSTESIQNYSSICGSNGATVFGGSNLRARIAQQIHVCFKYLVKERSDDSTVLQLLISIMNLLGNYGDGEYNEWGSKNHYILNSDSLMEPSFNFTDSFHTKGKKRPRWALVEKVHMHNIWRASQSSYHIFQMDNNIIPSEDIVNLMQDLLDLSLHNYEVTRFFAMQAVCTMLKRYPSLISNCIKILSEKLCDKRTTEYQVLGACDILSDSTVLDHLNIDCDSFSSFIIGILESFHHESLKCQEAITKLFLKFNKKYLGMPVDFSNILDGQKNCSKLCELVSKINLLDFSSTTLQWRYKLMADRILLLLTLSCTNNSIPHLKLHAQTTAHFLENLRTQIPQSRNLSITALNSLLQLSQINSQIQEYISQFFLKTGISNDVFTKLSLAHQDSDDESCNKRLFLNQSVKVKEMTFFLFDFASAFPNTPNWIYLDAFPSISSFNSGLARVFKRLVQESGTDILCVIQSMIEKFSCENERSKRTVATEALAGLLHSNSNQISDKWVENIFENIIMNEKSSFESVPEWAYCIRYSVTGKGKYGNEIPVFRQRILNCLMNNNKSKGLKAGLVAKRYYFLLIAFNEISPAGMNSHEVKCHEEILEEIIGGLDHLSPQEREIVGTILCVVCSNLRYFVKSNENQSDKAASFLDLIQQFTNTRKDIDTGQAETMLHFMNACLVSGKSSFLLDMILLLIYPVLSLQDTSNEDLSDMAKENLDLLSWRIFPRPFLESAIQIILSSSNDSNWKIRFTSLTYLEIFMYRHTFILSDIEKSQIWDSIKNLLSDNQVEVREHAAKILASLMRGGEEELSRRFCEESYTNALLIINRKKHRFQSVNSKHGVVLALAACVLSVPHDMPSWLPNHVTLLAKFITEPYPINSTVTKTIAEFKSSHANTWNIQKDLFTEEQIEVLGDTTLSSSYFA